MQRTFFEISLRTLVFLFCLIASGCASGPANFNSLVRNQHNYGIGRDAFARATLPHREQLDGTWRLIGLDSVTVSKADLDGVPFPVQELYADASTTLSRWAVALQELTFAPRLTLYEQDGLGATLSYSNAPWLDQGPQSVYLDQRQRAAVFPVLFRDAEHSIKRFACRMLDEDRLVCQVRALLCETDYQAEPTRFLWRNQDDFFRHVLSPGVNPVAPPDPEDERQVLRLLNEQVVAYYIYAKQR